ncbi:putative transcription factor AS2-LOB family [Medicago truncatula]|uniref:LOB domain protein n=1 Tax=Medicago truncatula TaxID=3880 RepID=A0A072VKM2_MEDTR|nr:LOB domain-containing protein 16 isoform X1 [Medicago truncatula]KEH42569.1 LOB domain protein [Medicago truncatula]RHN80074.1 putative transcription factor AS2-LOB family [Medicago truncatula]
MASANGYSPRSSGCPCGACKFLRRKCTSECIFAPYFCCEEGPARFAAIHKVFGAGNVSKMLLNLPVHDRHDAVVAIAYEAQARIIDPVYGCVSHIFALQQQVASLQAQLMQVKAQQIISQSLEEGTKNLENQWSGNVVKQQLINPFCPTNYMNPISPKSSLDSIDFSSCSINDVMTIQCQSYSNKRMTSYHLGERQETSLGMTGNYH